MVAPIDQGKNFLDRHFMANIMPQAPFAIDQVRKDREVKADKPLDKAVSSPTPTRKTGFFSWLWNKINS